MSDPRFMIKLMPAEEALKHIPPDVLILKIVDFYRRVRSKPSLIKLEGGLTEDGAMMTMEDIKKEFDEIPRRNSGIELVFGKT